MSLCNATGVSLQIPAFRNRTPNREHMENSTQLQQVRLTQRGEANFPLLHQFFSRFSWLSEMQGLKFFQTHLLRQAFNQK